MFNLKFITMKMKHSLIIASFALACTLSVAFSFISSPAYAETVNCPDGSDDCVTVETPAGTYVYHKGNPPVIKK